jgi:hypothetical protein
MFTENQSGIKSLVQTASPREDLLLSFKRVKMILHYAHREIEITLDLSEMRSRMSHYVILNLSLCIKSGCDDLVPNP